MIGQTMNSILELVNQMIYNANPNNKIRGPDKYNVRGSTFRTRIGRGMNNSTITVGPEYY